MSEEELCPNDTLTDDLRKFPVPTELKDVRSFLGLCNYYKKFIKGFADIARPLNNLLKKDTHRLNEVNWNNLALKP